jgi:5'-phosphate synthase pdxT subunit
MFQPLVEFARQKPMFGTCAGSILMAKHVVDFDCPTLAAIDIEIQRNAYGRQVASQIDSIEFDGDQLEVAFIRAPKIIAVADSETVLATWRESPVIVRNDPHMLATCHPEVLGNDAVHDYFLREFVV